MNKKALIIEGIFLIAVLLAAYHFLPKALDPLSLNEDGATIKVDNQDDDNTDIGDSVFQRFNDDEDSTTTTSPTVELQQFILTNGEEYWENWTREEKVVSGVVQEVDQVNSTMNIVITLPRGREFSDLERVAYVNCPLEQSALIKGSQPEQIVQERGVDILGTAAFQDRLYVYCLDQSCLNLGKQCILTDMSQ